MGGMSGSFHPSIARLFFSGIGPAGIQVGLEMSAGLPRPQPPSVGAAWRARTDEQNWLSEDEMEEDDDGFDAFVNRMRGNRGGPGTIFGGFAPSGQVRQQQQFNNGFTLASLLVEREQWLLTVCRRWYLTPLPPVTLLPIICKLALVLQPKRRWRFAEVIVTTMR
jgi:hypothetical protein